MSLDWQILEENKKKWKRKGFWRGIFFSIFLLLTFLIISYYNTFSSRFPHIARINVNGVILDNPELIKTINSLRTNDNVKSVFIRINSPGGTVVGAESLYVAINRLSTNKHVIALMGEVATSGGYIVALASDYILARYNTLTGSIGVIVEYPNFSKLSENLGISINSVKSGSVKGGQNPLSPINKSVRINDQKLVDYSFEWFLSLLKSQRKVEQNVLDVISDGRTLTGGMALDLGLIDGIGSEKEALDYLAKQDPKLATLQIIDVKIPSSSNSIWRELFQDISGSNFKIMADLFNSVKLISLAR